MPAQFYLRAAGSVTGPFDRGEIRRMLEREMLSFAHEVSADRRAWVPVHRGLDLLDATPDDAAPPRDDAASVADLIAPPPSAFPDAWTGALAGSQRRGGFFSLVDALQVATFSCGALAAFAATLPVGQQWGAPVFTWSRSLAGAAGYAALWLAVLAAVAATFVTTPRRADLACGLSVIGLLLSITLCVVNFLTGDGGRFAALESVKLVASLGAWAAVVATAWPALGGARRPASALAPLPPLKPQEIPA